MKYLHALVWGLVVGTVLRKWGYPIARAKFEAMDLDSVWEIWDDEELM
jgi:hypothetical protein